MREAKSWRNLLMKRRLYIDWGLYGINMKPLLGAAFIIMLYFVYRITNYQYLQTELDSRLDSLYTSKEYAIASTSLKGLPHGIIEAKSDLELKPLWSTSSSKLKGKRSGTHNLLAIPVGLKQKRNVNTIVQKFLRENFTVILFHYDGKVDGWHDLEWNNKVIHIVAQNQTKWWFAKRFLHPDAVSIYDFIFLWDEDLGVQHFNPKRYLSIVKAEGLETSQPALDPSSTDIHHWITIRKRTNKFHRRVYDSRGSVKCSDDSEGPPCSGRNGTSFSPEPPGIVLGILSSSSVLKISVYFQNDLVHGWGMDMKLGYCAQGGRSKKVGVVDSEYIVHQGTQTLGGASAKKTPDSMELLKKHAVDVRAEIRRQSTTELHIFKQRWEKAVKEDTAWVDPFYRRKQR